MTNCPETSTPQIASILKNNLPFLYVNMKYFISYLDNYEAQLIDCLSYIEIVNEVIRLTSENYSQINDSQKVGQEYVFGLFNNINGIILNVILNRLVQKQTEAIEESKFYFYIFVEFFENLIFKNNEYKNIFEALSKPGGMNIFIDKKGT